MSLRRILTVDADMAMLKQVSTPVAGVDDDLRALMDDMLQTMYDAPGIGLAAIQIGATSTTTARRSKRKPTAFTPPASSTRSIT